MTATLLLCSAFLAVSPAAVSLFHSGKWAQAETALRAELKRSPRDGDARLLLVRVLVAQGRRAEALEELSPLLAAGARLGWQLEAGRMLRQLAEQRFRDLRAAAPDSAAVRELAGLRLERQGDFAAALAEYQAAARLEPNRPGLRYLTGSAQWKLRDFPAAEASLRAELAANPQHGMANLRLGQTLLSTAREADAVPFLEKAVAALPELWPARRELGKAYRKAGQLPEARAAWEAVAKARPNDEEVHYLLGGLYRELGETELARRELETHQRLLAERRKLSEKR